MFYRLKVPANTTGVKAVTKSNYFAVKKLEAVVDAQIGYLQTEIEEGDDFPVEGFDQIIIDNNNDRDIEIVFWASYSIHYSNSKVSMNSSIDVMSQSAKNATNDQFNIGSSVTRIADLNTGRKNLTVHNNSLEKAVYLKASNAVGVLAKGLPLMPGSSMDFKTSEPIFAVSEDETVADVRTYEESY